MSVFLCHYPTFPNILKTQFNDETTEQCMITLLSVMGHNNLLRHEKFTGHNRDMVTLLSIIRV